MPLRLNYGRCCVCQSLQRASHRSFNPFMRQSSCSHYSSGCSCACGSGTTVTKFQSEPKPQPGIKKHYIQTTMLKNVAPKTTTLDGLNDIFGGDFVGRFMPHLKPHEKTRIL